MRCPSWTDRVLYSVGIYGSDAVRRLALDRYWSSDLLLSDHMPGERVDGSICNRVEHILEPFVHGV